MARSIDSFIDDLFSDFVMDSVTSSEVTDKMEIDLEPTVSSALGREVFTILVLNAKLRPGLIPIVTLTQMVCLDRQSYCTIKDVRFEVTQSLGVHNFDKASRAFAPISLVIEPFYSAIVDGKFTFVSPKNISEKNTIPPNFIPASTPEVDWLRLETQSQQVDILEDSHAGSTKRKYTMELIPCAFLNCCHITNLTIHWFFCWNIHNLPEELERLTLITKPYMKEFSYQHSGKKLFLSEKTRLRYLEYDHEHVDICCKEIQMHAPRDHFPKSIMEINITGSDSHVLHRTVPKMTTNFAVRYAMPDRTLTDLKCKSLFSHLAPFPDVFPFRNLERLHVGYLQTEDLRLLVTSRLIKLEIGYLVVHFFSSLSDLVEFAEQADVRHQNCFPETLRELSVHNRNGVSAWKRLNVPSHWHKLELHFVVDKIVIDSTKSELHTLRHTSNSNISPAAYHSKLKHLTVDFENRTSDRIAGSKLPPIKTLGLLNCDLAILKRAPTSLETIYTTGDYTRKYLSPQIAKLNPKICKI
jgi:hypothetical protein